jgi:hypothetical protein
VEAADDLSARLQTAGVPKHVADYLQALRPKFWLWWVAQGVFLPVMLAGFAVGALWLWPQLEEIGRHNALVAAMSANALMVQYNFGVSLILALFAWIFAAGAIGGVVGVLIERSRAGAFAYGILNAKRTAIGAWSVARTMRALSDEADPERFVRRATMNWQWWMVGAALVLSALSAYAVMRDVQAHGLYTRTHLIASPLLPWGSRAPVEWVDALKVEVGCNHVTGRNAYDTLIYRVHLPGRSFASLESGEALGDWLAAAEQIDAELRRASVPFERWQWLDRDPLDPACLSVMRNSWAEDYPRIERLLRIGELPDR